VFLAKATDASLPFVFEQQNFMDDRHFVPKLDLHEGPANRFTDLGGMEGFATKDNIESDDCCVLRKASDTGSDNRNFESARNAKDLNWPGTRAVEFSFGCLDHGIYVLRIVFGCDDSELRNAGFRL